MEKAGTGKYGGLVQNRAQGYFGELKSQIAHKDSVIEWKNKSGVAIGGLVVDTIAYNFLEAKKLYDKATSSDNLNLTKDFFEFLSNELEKQYYLALGSNQQERVTISEKSKRSFYMSLDAMSEDNENRKIQKLRDILENNSYEQMTLFKVRIIQIWIKFTIKQRNS